MQDLFDQQRAILRRDLLDSYETVAAIVAEEIRAPTVDEEKPPDEDLQARKTSRYPIAAIVIIGSYFYGT